MHNKNDRCPYESTYARKCVHKGVGQKKTKGKGCRYPNQEECEIYAKWLKESKKTKPWPFKIDSSHIEGTR